MVLVYLWNFFQKILYFKCIRESPTSPGSPTNPIPQVPGMVLSESDVCVMITQSLVLTQYLVGPSNGVCAHEKHSLFLAHAHGVPEVVKDLLGTRTVGVNQRIRLGV